eukprot:gb/GEZN01004957.1/.p1 GENE.gb/GEZN01004957.1/~~gb/GEZN01004957.1/.p1  ORF type:complete len:459 (-),score=28.25 gb/GEZN01004957.1/:495-1793(-)
MADEAPRSYLSAPARLGSGMLGLLFSGTAAHQALRYFSEGFDTSDDHKVSAFVPQEGTQKVLNIAGGEGLGPQMIPGLAGPSSLFLYAGEIAAELLSGATVEDVWAYGTTLTDTSLGVQGPPVGLPTGKTGDVMKGKLLSWPIIAFERKLQEADKIYATEENVVRGVELGVLTVVREDGTSQRSYWYYLRSSKLSSLKLPTIGGVNAAPGSVSIQSSVDRIKALLQDPASDRKLIDSAVAAVVYNKDLVPDPAILTGFARGRWRVRHAPHMQMLGKVLGGVKFDPVVYDFGNGDVGGEVPKNGLTSFAYYDGWVGKGWLATRGTWSLSRWTGASSVEIFWEDIWWNPGGNKAPSEDPKSGTAASIVSALGRAGFIPGISKFPINYCDEDLCIFTFALSGTCIVAEKVGPEDLLPKQVSGEKYQTKRISETLE